MDVGYYLGELLMQQGEVSVPGLGYFVQVRVSGYYNEEERKFYPPYHQAQFDVQSIDDDALAEYIANKKNISVASARYFCEKYITNLKQQAAIDEVQIGNLGWFYTELSHLTFRPVDKIADDTIFYGFEPIGINKANDVSPVEERPKVELNYPPKFAQTPPVFETAKIENTTLPESNVGVFETTLPGQSSVADPVAASQFITNDNYQAADQDISNEFFEPVEEEEEERKSPLLLIVVAVLFAVFVGLAVFALYRYQPDTFAKIIFWEKAANDTIAVKPKENIIAKVDTIAADTTRFIDTSANNVDTIVTTPSATTKTAVITQPTIVANAPASKTTVVEKPAAAKAAVATKPATAKTTVITQPAVTKTTIVTPPTTAAAISTVPVKPATAAIAKTQSTRIRTSDATGTRRFEVYVSPACKDMAQANRLITKLKQKGLDPRIVTDGAGPLIHVSIGHFKTAQEAKAYAVKVQETGKVTTDAYPNEIIPPL